MSDPQLEVLGIVFPALPENQVLVSRLREKYEIDFLSDQKEKKESIRGIPQEVWDAVEAECIKHVANLQEIKKAEAEYGQAHKREEASHQASGQQIERNMVGPSFDFETELARGLAHFILTDECLPFPQEMAEGIEKMESEDGTWFVATVGPFTDIEAFTAKLKRDFREAYRAPKTGAKNYIRNAHYYRKHKMGKSDAEIAELELEPQLKGLGIEQYSKEYFALEEKVKEKVRKGRKSCDRQLKGQADT